MRPVQIGEQAVLEVLVTPEMTVRFGELGDLHPVYATYELAKHFEEVGRKLLLPHLETGEDGLGTALSVRHLRSALPGMRVTLTATVLSMEGRRLTVDIGAVSELGDVVATGSTEQYVGHTQRVQAGFEELAERWRAFQEGQA
ncbi:thioesterase family protein (plasmid) [Deinococcus radiomollis]|uniref:thioesterase family protein n=1 Tax=Deinococcus radiomollis TaxID=468916 RepID=UPI003891CE1F